MYKQNDIVKLTNSGLNEDSLPNEAKELNKKFRVIYRIDDGCKILPYVIQDLSCISRCFIVCEDEIELTER